MPTELIVIGGILVVAAGGLIFVFLRRQKAAEPLHFR
jgi:LPXTG-motif cell wall-anchored protein